jgi:polysaccharide export outer membrane protein
MASTSYIISMPYSGSTWLVLVVLLASLMGCQNSSFQATSLPPQYQAPRIPSARSLDLSELARSSTGSEVIQPGDLLEVTIATGVEREESPRLLRVSADGTITVPLIGQVTVAGLELPMAEAAIRETGIRNEVYRRPQVAIQLKDRYGSSVTVLGAVKKPGTYRIASANTDLLAALIAAGGLHDNASTVVEIRHPANLNRQADQLVQRASHQSVPWIDHRQRTVRIDLMNAESTSDDQLRLFEGSVVMVPPRAPSTIYVMGLVKEAKEYEIPIDEELRLLDSIAMAGGRTLELADKVQIVRTAPNVTDPIVITASVREAQRNGAANLRLAPGDVVTVEETPLTFTIETVRSFIRFGFSSSIPGI